MSDGLLDEQKITTELTQRAINRVIEFGEKTVKVQWARFKNRDSSAYSEYLTRKRAAAGSVRNFIYDSNSAKLMDIYVHQKLSSVDYTSTSDLSFIKALNTPPLDENSRPTKAYLVTGPAGIGKSLLLKYVFFMLQQLSRIPLYLEARTFNRLKISDIETRLHDDFVSVGAKILKEQIILGLESGLFVIIIDGIDELKLSIQSHYETALIEFAGKYPLCPLVISSRPAENIKSWRLFQDWTIDPMDIEQVQVLLEKLNFETRVKHGFLLMLHKGLYESHFEFISRPLLCIIMLLTYSDSGRISNHRHEFFEDAFIALWSKHDARKEGFERSKYTGLEKTDFLRLLSAFAISSYRESDFNMRESQFRSHFRLASDLSGVKCREEDFRKDLLISTSLAVEEGRYLRFCHRTFHEYFAAIFICNTSDEACRRLVDDLSSRIETDYVLPLVKSMAPEKIECDWVAPRVDKIVEKLNSIGDGDSYGDLIVNQLDQGGELAYDMYTVRILYQMTPELRALEAAYFAAVDMNESISSLSRGDWTNNHIFGRDLNNFRKLSADLTIKYNKRHNALLDLISSRD